MNKGDLIEAVASQMGESKATATKVVDIVLDTIANGVQKDDKVAITGFGTFKKKHRKARKGINPATREPIDIPASTSVGFTPSQNFKDSLSS
ncbi:MAG: HU family DNA-binding protein [bacterium]|nr:HU family DNA-binding protein [bacterium]